MNVLVLHGPNLNLLGDREPDVYGDMTLPEIDARIALRAEALGMNLRTAQSNVEGELINHLHDAASWADGVIFNPGGYAHTSVAIRDAVAAMTIPVVEVHLSNPMAREEFRHRSIVGEACAGTISGFGWRSYEIALVALAP